MRLRYFLLMLSALSLPFISGYSAGDDFEGFFPDLPSDFTGENISFSFDPMLWCIEGVDVYGVEMIEKLCLPRAYMWDFENHGFDLDTRDYELSIGNFSEPSIVYKSTSRTRLEFRVSDGVSIDEKKMILEKDGVWAEIISDGDIKVKEDTVEISLEKGNVFQIRFYLKSPHQGMSPNSFKDALSDAFRLHKIGAEARIEKGMFSAISYNNITIKPLEISDKRAVLRLSSNESSGRCIYLHVDINISNPRVMMDDVEIEKGSYYDALFSTGNDAIWNLTVYNGERSLIVYIPHFSGHTLVVESVESSSQPVTSSSIIPVIAALIISSVAAVALIGKKRKGP